MSKSTPLTQIHIDLGAKMAPFAGYDMPISYDGIVDEHLAVRNNVGVFDVSHMGEFIIKGPEALELVQKIVSNNAAKLEVGDVMYSYFPNEQGGIVDDLLVYRLPLHESFKEGDIAFMLVVNASNIEKDFDWVLKNNTFDTRVMDISDETGLLAVQGPNAINVLQKLTDIDLSKIKYYNFTKGKFAGLDNVLISATGYTGAGGFEIYVDSKDLMSLWKAIFDAGKEFDIKPVGLGARDTLRLEKGYCLYGHEINDQSNPFEAGLGWITKLKKGDFNSIDKLVELKANQKRKLRGLVMQDRRIPRQDMVVESLSGEEIGIITSGTHSPSMDKPIGIAYLQTEFSEIGSTVNVVFRKKRLPADVVAIPFL